MLKKFLRNILLLAAIGLVPYLYLMETGWKKVISRDNINILIAEIKSSPGVSPNFLKNYHKIHPKSLKGNLYTWQISKIFRPKGRKECPCFLVTIDIPKEKLKKRMYF